MIMAQLSTKIIADRAPHSLEISFVPNRMPTTSPSYTVWCSCEPSFSHSEDFCLLFLYKTAAAPISPFIPEPSVNTFIPETSDSRFSMAMSGF